MIRVSKPPPMNICRSSHVVPNLVIRTGPNAERAFPTQG